PIIKSFIFSLGTLQTQRKKGTNPIGLAPPLPSYLNRSKNKSQNPFSSSIGSSTTSGSSYFMLSVLKTNCTEFTFSFLLETNDTTSKSDLSYSAIIPSISSVICSGRLLVDSCNSFVPSWSSLIPLSSSLVPPDNSVIPLCSS